MARNKSGFGISATLESRHILVRGQESLGYYKGIIRVFYVYGGPNTP
jgi:hypothetical protein